MRLPLSSRGLGLDVVRGGRALGYLFEAPDLRTRGGASRPQAVDRAAARGDEEPGEDLAARRVEGRGRTPREEEHLLEDFLRLAAIAQDAAGEGQEPPGVPVVELGERVRVPGLDPGHQGAVGIFASLARRAHRTRRLEDLSRTPNAICRKGAYLKPPIGA